MISRKLALILLILISAENLALADYKAQCLGPDGKFRRCYLTINQENLVVRYKLGPTVQIPGNRIFRVVYQKEARKNENNSDPVFLTSFYKANFGAYFNGYDSFNENTVLGIQFTDQERNRNALLMHLHDDEGRGLQMQLESISKQEAVPLQ